MDQVEVMAKIKQANVVGYFESFVEDGSLHIAMEYADGGTTAFNYPRTVDHLILCVDAGSLQRQWKKAQEAGIHFSEKQILHWCAQVKCANAAPSSTLCSVFHIILWLPHYALSS